MDLKQYSAAALDAINNGDTNAGTGDSIVDNYSRSSFGNVLAGLTAGTGAVGAAADAAEKAAASAQIQKLKDRNDPSKFQKIRKQDGGFDFLDPEGNPVSVSTWAKATGATRAEALDGSENPLDQQFLNDYNNMNDLNTSINNGDAAAVKTFMQNNQSIDPNTKPQNLMKDFAKKYPHIFGTGSYADTQKNLNKPMFSSRQPASGSYGDGATGASNDSYGWAL